MHRPHHQIPFKHIYFTVLALIVPIAGGGFIAPAERTPEPFHGERYPFIDQEKSLQILPFDKHNDEGIPLRLWGDGSLVVHPVWLAQTLLAYYGDGKLDESRSGVFKRYVTTILDAKSLTNPMGILSYSFDYVAGRYKYPFRAGWGSAMAQGQMLSVLARAHHRFPQLRGRIDAFARRLLSPLTRSVQDGGLTYSIRIGEREFPFYAEYPSKIAAPLTLNGFIFTLVGLKEYGEQAHSGEAMVLYRKGLETLRAIVPFYDRYPLSVYDLSFITHENVVANQNPNYHKIHGAQLAYMANVEGDAQFKCIAESIEAKNGYWARVRVKFNRLLAKLFGASNDRRNPQRDTRCDSFARQDTVVYARNQIGIAGGR